MIKGILEAPNRKYWDAPVLYSRGNRKVAQTIAKC